MNTCRFTVVMALTALLMPALAYSESYRLSDLSIGDYVPTNLDRAYPPYQECYHLSWRVGGGEIGLGSRNPSPSYQMPSSPTFGYPDSTRVGDDSIFSKGSGGSGKLMLEWRMYMMKCQK